MGLHQSGNGPKCPKSLVCLGSHGEGQKMDLPSNTSVYNATLSHGDSGLMPTITFDDLLERTFLLPSEENGGVNVSMYC